MRTLFGKSVLPPDSAAVVLRAVNRAVALGDVPGNARWLFVEYMAAEYLAGSYTERELRELQAAAEAAEAKHPE